MRMRLSFFEGRDKHLSPDQHILTQLRMRYRTQSRKFAYVTGSHKQKNAFSDRFLRFDRCRDQPRFPAEFICCNSRFFAHGICGRNSFRDLGTYVRDTVAEVVDGQKIQLPGDCFQDDVRRRRSFNTATASSALKPACRPITDRCFCKSEYRQAS